MSAVVVSTTETASIDSAVAELQLARTLPHEVFDPKTGEVRTMMDWPGDGTALIDADLHGCHTNNRVGGVYQIWVVGYAGYVLEMPDDWYQSLAEHLASVAHDIDAPVRMCREQWNPYLGSFGPESAQRMGPQRWATFNGICGVQHVPFQGSGAPGDLNRLARWLPWEDDLMTDTDNDPEPTIDGGPQADQITESQRLINTVRSPGEQIAVNGIHTAQTTGAIGVLVHACQTYQDRITDLQAALEQRGVDTDRDKLERTATARDAGKWRALVADISREMLYTTAVLEAEPAPDPEPADQE